MKNLFWDFLFPVHCIICEKPDKYICDDCFSHIPIKTTSFCPLCQRVESFAGRVCNYCENEKKNIHLDGAIVSSYYRHPVLRDLIYHFKYGFVKKLAFPLAKLLAKKLFGLETFPFEEFVFTAVPLHQKRQSWRGFNQAVILGEKLQNLIAKNNLDIDFIPYLLLRHRYLKPQMKIRSTAYRKKNIVGCFSINPKYLNKVPKKIIIIDDILTTGATLNECAKILKSHGAEKVWGLVIARQGK